MDKAAKYHNWVALPFRSVTVDGPPFSVPRYLHLDLGKLMPELLEMNAQMPS